MTWHEIVTEQLIRHEEKRSKPYPDSKGLITIGIGRCLDKKPLKDAEIMFLFEYDLADAEDDARALLGDPCFEALSDVRKAVVVNMAFNLGLPKLRKFVKFIAAVKAGQWSNAAKEMRDSDWSKDVKGRADELIALMERG